MALTFKSTRSTRSFWREFLLFYLFFLFLLDVEAEKKKRGCTRVSQEVLIHFSNESKIGGATGRLKGRNFLSQGMKIVGSTYIRMARVQTLSLSLTHSVFSTSKLLLCITSFSLCNCFTRAYLINARLR